MPPTDEAVVELHKFLPRAGGLRLVAPSAGEMLSSLI